MEMVISSLFDLVIAYVVLISWYYTLPNSLFNKYLVSAVCLQGMAISAAESTESSLGKVVVVLSIISVLFDTSVT